MITNPIDAFSRMKQQTLKDMIGIYTIKENKYYLFKSIFQNKINIKIWTRLLGLFEITFETSIHFACNIL